MSSTALSALFDDFSPEPLNPSPQQFAVAGRLDPDPQPLAADHLDPDPLAPPQPAAGRLLDPGYELTLRAYAVSDFLRDVSRCHQEHMDGGRG